MISRVTCVCFLLTLLFSSAAWSQTWTWISLTEGNWNEPANWSANEAPYNESPGVGDDVIIPGSTGEVLVTSSVSVGTITVQSGGEIVATESLVATLSVNIDTGGELIVRGTSLSTTTLTNEGIFSAESGNASPSLHITTFSNINNGLVSVLAYDSDLSFTIHGSFTNGGQIQLSAYHQWGNTLNSTLIVNGTLTNTHEITALYGSGGGNRTLQASSIINTSSGKFIASTEDFTVNYQAGGSFTNSGVLQAATDQKLVLSGGGTTTFQAGTALSGGGMVDLAGTQILELQSTVTVDPSSGGLSMSGDITVNHPAGGGTAVINILAGASLTTSGDTINVPVTNAGLLVCEGGGSSTTTSLNGAVSNISGATLRAYANEQATNLVIANGFTNYGTIEIQSYDNYESGTTKSTLTITSGELINNGVIAAKKPGRGHGEPTLDANLTNNAQIEVEDPGASTQRYDLTVKNIGHVFSNSAVLSVPETKKISIEGGTTRFNGGTTLGGNGVVDLAGTHIIDLTSSLTLPANTTGLSFSGSATIGGVGVLHNQSSLEFADETINATLRNDGGTITVKPGTTGLTTIGGTFENLSNSTVHIYAYELNAQLNITNSFTNYGLIQLSSYRQYGGPRDAVLVLGNGMTNNGELFAKLGYQRGGLRKVTGNILNNGKISAQHTLTVDGTLTHQGSVSTDFTILKNSSGNYYGKIASTQPLVLSGTLDVQFDSSYTPVSGDFFTLIEPVVGGLSGDWSSVTLADPGTEKVWRQTMTADSYSIAIRDLTTGDINGDSYVDLKDVISSLHVLSGQTSISSFRLDATLNDATVKMADAIAVLQELAAP